MTKVPEIGDRFIADINGRKGFPDWVTGDQLYRIADRQNIVGTSLDRGYSVIKMILVNGGLAYYIFKQDLRWLEEYQIWVLR